MPYSAAAVANELLDRAAGGRHALTQINIQKLVYFAHGWHLAWRGTPLILGTFEAWRYGPVVRDLYNQFRRFGSAPITDKAREFSVNRLNQVVTSVPALDHSEAGEYARGVIGAVWKQYGSLKPFQLVELTHVKGSPWEKARQAGLDIIENEAIREYFSAMAKSVG